MKDSISNSELTVTVKRCGAELCSVRSAGDREYIWQADPDVWGGHSPLLFPIVGKLLNDSYSFDGDTYKMGIHGFAKRMNFELIREEADCLSYQILPTAETKDVYPFDFAVCVTYRLKDNALEISFEVKNNGERLMPFSIGAHPGLAMNWHGDDQVEDYFLEFEKEETVGRYILDENHLLPAQSAPLLENERILSLHKNIFDRDALIFLEHKSRKLTLCSKKSDTRVTVEFPGFSQLGVWAKPGAPYVCIEPWIGCDDQASHNGDILTKLGIVCLEAGKTFVATYRILIEE